MSIAVIELLNFAIRMTTVEMLKSSTLSLLVVIYLSIVGQVCGKHVIIVGAGVSGLGAGRTLVNAGHTVTILEARDRFGGRIWTNKNAIPNAQGAEVDLGAAWMHGSSSNHPITKLQQQLNLEAFETRDDTTLYVDPDSGQVWDDDSPQADAAWGKVTEMLSEAPKYEHATEDQSVGSIITTKFPTYIQDKFVVAYIADALEEEYGTRAGNISARMFNQGEAFDGKEEILVNGYVGIPTGLVNGIGNEKSLAGDIIYNKPVVTVAVEGDMVKVSSSSGDQYTGDAVIVTVPLGVLKAGTITFSPPLSSERQAAINKMGFGNWNKCIYEFDNIFWNEETHYFQTGAPSYEQRGWFQKWINFYPVIHRPVLVTQMVGPAAWPGEELEDEIVKQEGLKVLRSWSKGGVDNVNLVSFYRTKWGQEEFTRGTYSYFAVGSTLSDREALRQPSCPVYFAGEHTSVDYAATVHGAYLSGVDMANMIINDQCDITSSAAQSISYSLPSVITSIFLLYLSHL